MRTVIHYMLCSGGFINILRKLEKEVMEDGSEHGYLTTMIVDAEVPAYVVSRYDDYDKMISLFVNSDDGQIDISKDEWEEWMNEFIEIIRKTLK